MSVPRLVEIAAETTLMRRSSDGHGVHTARHLKRLDPASLRRCVDARVLSAIYQENKKTIRGNYHYSWTDFVQNLIEA